MEVVVFCPKMDSILVSVLVVVDGHGAGFYPFPGRKIKV